ncbi:MAG: hypothetical protein Q8S02_16660 [Hydrogenophaga sp.]|nr:hypothetical protein [Hydrogenophaga sp.]
MFCQFKKIDRATKVEWAAYQQTASQQVDKKRRDIFHYADREGYALSSVGLCIVLAVVAIFLQLPSQVFASFQEWGPLHYSLLVALAGAGIMLMLFFNMHNRRVKAIKMLSADEKKIIGSVIGGMADENLLMLYMSGLAFKKPQA